MDISGIASPSQLPGSINNGDVKVTKAYEFDPQKENRGIEQTTPAVIRHPPDDTPPGKTKGVTEGVEMYRQVNFSGRRETSDEFHSRKNEAADIFFKQLAPIAANMRRHLDQMMDKVSKEHPDLAPAEWGFSIKSDGSLFVTGQLAQKDEMKLAELLNESDGLKVFAREFSELLMKGMALDRGSDKGTQGLGKYELNPDNFSEVIDLREYLDSPFTGRNKQTFSSAVNKNDIARLFTYAGYSELEDQLASRGNVVYNRGFQDKYDFDTGEWSRVSRGAD